MGPMLRRRAMLAAPLPLLGLRVHAAELHAQRLATAWRTPAGDHRVGILVVDWAAARIAVVAEVALPGRAHGLLPLPDGGFVVVANRPGRWLMRLDRSGVVARTWQVPEGGRTLNGHAELAADGRTLLTSETDPGTGDGWVARRHIDTLAPGGAGFASQGIDPHQMLSTGDGTLWVANGGIARDALGRKLAGAPMAPSLVRLAVADGTLRGHWTLPDPRLSIRHLALAAGGGEPFVGVALQAEHDTHAERVAAPALAVCDGRQLHLPTLPAADAALAAGYAGDISAGPGGGFVVSAQKQGRALWWHPGDPGRLTRVAEITEPCGLVAWPDGAGTQVSAGRGLALWHARHGARMLAWPLPLAPDNHIVRLA
jgi:uncharacterized protein